MNTQDYCEYASNCQAITVREGAFVSNAIVLSNPTFRRCRFYGVTILVNKGVAQSPKTGIPGLTWLDPIEDEAEFIPPSTAQSDTP
jgi:hypothetical protein